MSLYPPIVLMQQNTINKGGGPKKIAVDAMGPKMDFTLETNRKK